MELRLGRGEGSQTQVICDGQPSHDCDLGPLLLPGEQKASTLLADPVAYGQRLFGALFPAGTPAAHTFEAHPERIVLVAESAELDALPWEYLVGPAGFVVQSHSFVRGLPEQHRIAAPAMETPPHILAVPSNPLSARLQPLAIEAEWMNLRESVHGLPFALTLERVRPPTLAQLRRLVAGQRQRVIHFMGHGVQEAQRAVLALEKEDGGVDLVQAQEFGLCVQDTTFLVTLNACSSATPGLTELSNLAGALVRQKIPYVLGMRLSIADADARLFAHAFYDDLVRGSSVEQALVQARLVLARQSAHPWAVGVPVLYTSLAEAAAGFVRREGSVTVLEREPRLEVSGLLRAEGGLLGRVDEIRQVSALLTGDQRARVVTVHAGGGQGKTALVREVVERVGWAWPGGVWARTLEEVPERGQVVGELAQFLGMSLQEIGRPLEEVERQVQARLGRRRTLLVLDGAESLVEAVERGETAALQLSQWLQRLPGSTTSLLVTSRVPLGWVNERLYKLEGLSPEKGAALFEQCVPGRKEEITREEAENLSKKVGGRPFSLRLLGAAFSRKIASLADLFQEYDGQFTQQPGDAGSLHPSRSFSTALEISLRALSLELRQLLRGLCIFHAPFLAETAVALFDPEHKEAEGTSLIRIQLEQLCQSGLLTHMHVPIPGKVLCFYHLPVMIRLYVEQHLALAYQPEKLYQRFGTVCADVVQQSFEELNASTDSRVFVRRTSIDSERGIAYVTGTKQVFYRIRWAWVLHSLGDVQRSLKLFEEIIDAIQAYEYSARLFALTSLGRVYRGTGQMQSAISLFEQILSLYREIGDRAGEAATLNDMGEVYHDGGQVEEAQHFCEQALLLWREASDHAGQATSLGTLAKVYRSMGQMEQALDLYEQALPLWREIGSRAKEAATLDNMGEIFAATGKVERATDFYERALPLWREVGDRASEASTLNSLGLVTTQAEQATEFYKQALLLLQEIDDPSGKAIVLNNMGHVTEHPEQALHLFERSLAVAREANNRSLEILNLLNIASVYSSRGNPGEALDTYEQALAIARELGDRREEARTLGDVASVYDGMENEDQALSRHEQALLIWREVGDHYEEAKTLHSLGEISRNTGKLQQALMFYEQALPLWRGLGNRFGETDTLNGIARTYRIMDQSEQAVHHYEQALSIAREIGYRRAEGTSLNGMAVAYGHLGQAEQSILLYQQALLVIREGGRHDAEANTLHNMGLLFYQYLNRPQDGIASIEEAISVLERAGLSETAGGQTKEGLLQLLEMMRSGDLGVRQQEAIEPLSDDQRAEYIRATIAWAVMTFQPGEEGHKHRETWRIYLEQELRRARSSGEAGRTEKDFFAVLLALMEQGPFELSPDHPLTPILRANIIAELKELGQIAFNYRASGQWGQALYFYEQALRIFTGVHDRTGEIDTLNNLGNVYCAMGRAERALHFYERALRISQEIGDPAGEVTARSNIAGVLYLFLDRPQEAIATLEEAIALFESTEFEQTAGGLTEENLRSLLHSMSHGVPLFPKNLMISIFPVEMIDEQDLEGTDYETALLLNNLAAFYFQIGRDTEAEPLQERALPIWEQLLGVDHPDTERCRTNLKKLYEKQGKYAKKKELCQRTLEVKEQQLGVDHPDIAESLNELALLCQEMSEYSEAEHLYQRALELREKVLGVDHPDTAMSLSNLAYLYDAQGRYDEAEPLLKRAIEIREQHLGIDHLDTAVSLNNLAMLYQNQGKYAEVEPLLQRVLTIWDRQPGTVHTHLAAALNNLAAFYRESGRYAEAEPLYQRVLGIMEELWGTTNYRVGGVLNNLAELYINQGKYGEVEPLLRRALGIFEQQLGAMHPGTALTLSNLGGLYLRQKKYKEAEPLLQRALEIYEQQLGVMHPETARVLNQLGDLYNQQEMYSEAEPLLQRALEIDEQQLGAMHPSVARSLNNLASLYHSQERYKEAELFYQRSLAIWEQQWGVVHPDVALGLNNLGKLYQDQGRYEEGEPLLRRSLAICERIWGREHPTTEMVQANYTSFIRQWSMSQSL